MNSLRQKFWQNTPKRKLQLQGTPQISYIPHNKRRKMADSSPISDIGTSETPSRTVTYHGDDSHDHRDSPANQSPSKRSNYQDGRGAYNRPSPSMSYHQEGQEQWDNHRSTSRGHGHYQDNRNNTGRGYNYGSPSPTKGGWYAESPPNRRSGSYSDSSWSGSSYRNEDPTVALSKFMSMILRHKAENYGFKLEKGGFLYLDDLMKHQRFKGFTVEDIKWIVDTNEKKRFAIVTEPESNRLKIRANQGHTVEIDELDLKPILSASEFEHVVHGTYSESWEIIKLKGLCKMKRNHIHFARGEPGNSGVISGMRSTCQVMIYLDLEKCLKDGLKFFCSANDVILSPGNKDGIIYPCYFKDVLNRYPNKHLLPFDKTISGPADNSPDIEKQKREKEKRKPENKEKRNYTWEESNLSEDRSKGKGKGKNKQKNKEKSKQKDEKPKDGKQNDKTKDAGSEHGHKSTDPKTEATDPGTEVKEKAGASKELKGGATTDDSRDESSEQADGGEAEPVCSANTEQHEASGGEEGANEGASKLEFTPKDLLSVEDEFCKDIVDKLVQTQTIASYSLVPIYDDDSISSLCMVSKECPYKFSYNDVVISCLKDLLEHKNTQLILHHCGKLSAQLFQEHDVILTSTKIVDTKILYDDLDAPTKDKFEKDYYKPEDWDIVKSETVAIERCVVMLNVFSQYSDRIKGPLKKEIYSEVNRNIDEGELKKAKDARKKKGTQKTDEEPSHKPQQQVKKSKKKGK